MKAVVIEEGAGGRCFREFVCINCSFIVHFFPPARYFFSTAKTTSSMNQQNQSSDENGSKVKDKSAEKDKDSSQSSRSADSGEEVEKDFIFV